MSEVHLLHEQDSCLCECCGTSAREKFARYGVEPDSLFVGIGGLMVLCLNCEAGLRDMPYDFVPSDERVKAAAQRYRIHREKMQ